MARAKWLSLMNAVSCVIIITHRSLRSQDQDRPESCPRIVRGGDEQYKNGNVDGEVYILNSVVIKKAGEEIIVGVKDRCLD